MEVVEFWQLLNRRRRLARVWSLLWPLAGASCLIAYHTMTGSQISGPFMVFLLISWGSVGGLLALRVVRMRCPKCGNRAVLFIWERQSSCVACGSNAVRP